MASSGSPFRCLCINARHPGDRCHPDRHDLWPLVWLVQCSCHEFILEVRAWDWIELLSVIIVLHGTIRSKPEEYLKYCFDRDGGAGGLPHVTNNTGSSIWRDVARAAGFLQNPYNHLLVSWRGP